MWWLQWIRYLLTSREGQQQRLDDTGCTFLCQERGSNNGSTIPGAPSYVKRGAATTAWQYLAVCTFLATSREGQQQRLVDNTWLVHLLMSREGQQQWLNNVWRRMKAEARCPSLNNNSTTLLFNEKVCVEHERYCIQESGIL
jgi:hypothetical protein